MQWQLEVDPLATARAHAARESGDPETCGCLYCRNFVSARQVAYPAEFVQLLSELGVPPNRESEVFQYAEVEPGLHLYGGWFHFVGSVSAGPDAQPGGPSGGAMTLTHINDRFSLGFTKHAEMVPKSFLAPEVTQIEFTAKVPWLLSETCTG